MTDSEFEILSHNDTDPESEIQEDRQIGAFGIVLCMIYFIIGTVFGLLESPIYAVIGAGRFIIRKIKVALRSNAE